MKTNLLLSAVMMVSGAVVARAQVSDAGFAGALKTVRAESAQTRRDAESKNPCLANRQLDATGFELTVAGKDETSFSALFEFESCYVHDRGVDGDPETPSAVRHYLSKKTGYKLDLRTESGSERTDVTLLQYMSDATFLNSGFLGNVPTNQLAVEETEFPKVTLTDFRWQALTIKGRAILEPFHGSETLSDMRFTACWTRPVDAEAEEFGLPRTFCLYRVGLAVRPFDEGRTPVEVDGFFLKGSFPLTLTGRTPRGYEARSMILHKQAGTGGCSGWMEASISLGFEVSLSGDILSAEPTVEAGLGETNDDCHEGPSYRTIKYTINHDD